MKKRSLTIIILVILAVIVGVIVADFFSNRPDRRGGNPFALDVDAYREVDEGLISHRETRNFSLGGLNAGGIASFNGLLYLVGDSSLVRLSADGQVEGRFPIFPFPTCVAVDDSAIYVGYRSGVAAYDHEGNQLVRWPDLGEKAVVTSLATGNNKIYVADAGNRQVIILGREGQVYGSFEGKAGEGAIHGFIVPSPNFEVVVNSYGDVWVVNPGKHAIENYTDDGELRGYWEKSTMKIEGFQGCCNPAELAVLEDGSFVTSEKGLVRIKIYDESGQLESVVAPPALFKEEGKAPEVCTDGRGTIYALDFDRNTVRIFEPKNDG